MILGYPDEKDQIIRISIIDLHIFDCNSKADFEEYVLEPLIQKTAIKRNLDFKSTIELISFRLNWEECY